MGAGYSNTNAFFVVFIVQILIHIGALSDKSGFKLAENANHGGPLGELVQWSDLIACLYLLGHTIDITTEFKHLMFFLVPENACVSTYDVIYTDIMGLKQFRKTIHLPQYK